MKAGHRIETKRLQLVSFLASKAGSWGVMKAGHRIETATFADFRENSEKVGSNEGGSPH